MADYSLTKITTEIYVATCDKCGKTFSSDVEQKAINKVQSHIKDKHG